ncbi:MAG: hypothetical protein IPJ87_00020 [Flavobacteriales bacterium]|nr:hypothetical protein [Flavobacteriales bacterium]
MRLLWVQVHQPAAHSSSIGRYYESADYISHSNSRRTLSDRSYQVARRRALARKHALVATHRTNGRVLDVDVVPANSSATQAQGVLGIRGGARFESP